MGHLAKQRRAIGRQTQALSLRTGAEAPTEDGDGTRTGMSRSGRLRSSGMETPRIPRDRGTFVGGLVGTLLESFHPNKGDFMQLQQSPSLSSAAPGRRGSPWLAGVALAVGAFGVISALGLSRAQNARANGGLGGGAGGSDGAAGAGQSPPNDCFVLDKDCHTGGPLHDQKGSCVHSTCYVRLPDAGMSEFECLFCQAYEIGGANGNAGTGGLTDTGGYNGGGGSTPGDGAGGSLPGTGGMTPPSGGISGTPSGGISGASGGLTGSGGLSASGGAIGTGGILADESGEERGGCSIHPNHARGAGSLLFGLGLTLFFLRRRRT